MVRITTIVSALIISAGLAAPALAQGQGDLERAQRENERLLQRQQELQQENIAARQRSEELARQAELNAAALRAHQERNHELRAGMEASAERIGALMGPESVMKAEFDLERLEQRLAMLRDQKTMLRQSESQIRADPEAYVRLQAQLAETEKRLYTTGLEVADARLRVEQVKRLEALRRGPLVSLDFPGGTMEAFVAAVRTSLGDRPVNVLISESGKDKPVPGVRLESVTVEAALRAAITAAGRGGGGFWNLIPLSSGSDGGAPVYRLEFQPLPSGGAIAGARGGGGAAGAGRDGGGPRQVQVYSIGDIITGPGEGISPEALLSAIEAGLSLAAPEGEPAPDLKFHPDSKLLIVRGDEQVLRLVRDIIGEVNGDIMRRRTESAHAQAAAREREAGIRMAEINLAEAEKALEFQRARFNETKALAEKGQWKGQSPNSELLEIKAEVDRAEAALARARLGMQMAEEHAGVVIQGPRTMPQPPRSAPGQGR
jgi:hypothetical protein